MLLMLVVLTSGSVRGLKTPRHKVELLSGCVERLGFSGGDLCKHGGVWAGDITSRLAADTTTVSDQITLNLNVAMRSVAQAALVLVFMLRASWRLTVVSLIIIPFELLISKVYGGVYRSAAAPCPCN
jgi:ABC-type multidrug transport system fused ATPase/permease subunit